MSRLLYENSVAYKGHLIIPFVFGIVDGQHIYSYDLLSELGNKGKFQKAQNPAGIYSSSINSIIDVAKEHLDEYSDVVYPLEIFKSRYTYRHNLIMIYGMSTRFFYDHYPPEELRNIAAPKLFKSEMDCINWVKEGLDRAANGQEVQ
ncbi:hypothetical protein [Argonema galeatum]|uniref:hypothetical protein n=1 Tax=Argonema galeatum TaxID=2942762 RepID=UPI00201151E4|nr:hypothetical protein [Argonema galeatum]MCL1463165.1 hypothetical protein [Argonema galeatum A003/A1]